MKIRIRGFKLPREKGRVRRPDRRKVHVEEKVLFPSGGMTTDSARMWKLGGSEMVSCLGFVDSSFDVGVAESRESSVSLCLSSFVIIVTDAPERRAALVRKRKYAGRTAMYCARV